MRKSAFVLTFFFGTALAFAQDPSFVTEMERALHIHDTTSTFAGELMSD